MARQPDIHIHISVPNEFAPLAKYNIGITAGIENTAPKAEWIKGMNMMDLNIVPSKFTKEVFKKTIYEQMDEKTGQKTGELKLTKPIEDTVNLIDQGKIRVAEKIGKEWKINQWIKKAILLSFRINEQETISNGPGNSVWWDKVPSKFNSWKYDGNKTT